MKNTKIKVFRWAIAICLVLALSAAAIVCLAMQKSGISEHVGEDNSVSAYTESHCCM